MPVGLRLPPYEADTLSWIAACLSGNSLQGGAQVNAEVLLGQDAVLLRFPSGGERYLYLDDRPHGLRTTYTPEEIERTKFDLTEAEAERGDALDRVEELTRELHLAREDLSDAARSIRDARALLDQLRDEDKAADLPEWLQDRLAGVRDELSSPF
jgi:hypothetical protein